MTSSVASSAFPAAADCAPCLELELKLLEDFAKDGITAREHVIAWARDRPHAQGERAWHLAQVVGLMRMAAGTGLVSEEDSWHVMLFSAKLAQQSYDSWEAFAGSYLRGCGSPR